MDESRLSHPGWRVAGAYGAGVFFSTLPFYAFAVFLKPLASELGESRQAVAAAYGAMAAVAALAAPLVGLLLDRRSARSIAAPALALTGCAFASLAAFSPQLGSLYVIFVLLGLGASGGSALAYSRAVSAWFDRRRGLALGLVMSGGALGGMLHPPAAQALIRLFGWRTAYLVLGGVIFVAGVPIVGLFVRECAATRAGTGAALLEPVAGATVAEALRSRVFWILVIVVFGSTLASNGAIVHLSALLTDRGVAAGRAALAVSAMGGASLAGRLATGWLLDRFSAPRVSFALLALAAAGTALLAGAHSFAAGALAAALIGFGIGGELDVTPYLLARTFGLRSISTLYGLTWTALGLAGAAGPILLGRAFDATGSYTLRFLQLAAGTLAVAALMLTLPAGPAPRPPSPP